MGKYERQLQAVEIEMREVAQKANSIIEKAENSGRSMNDDEATEVRGLLKKQEVLEEQKSELEEAIATRQKVADVGARIKVEERKTDDTPAHRRAESIGEAFVKSAGYRSAKQGGFSGSWSTGPVEIETKALLDSSAVGSEGDGLLQPSVQPGIQPTLFQRLTVADLMASGTVAGSSIRYMVEASVTNAAAGVAEGAPKPESGLTFDAVDEPVKKIATFLPVTDEMLEDVPALRSYIDGRLRLFVQMEEERQLLNGSGGNQLAGLLGRIPSGNLGVSAGVGANIADNIFAAITKVRTFHLEPDGIVINPEDWAAVQTAKLGDGYMGSGPFGGPHNNIWGKRLVVTTAVAAGSPLVGAFQTAAQVYRKGGISVEASNSHAEFFRENKVAIRAEERLALAVYRPEAFATADLS